MVKTAFALKFTTPCKLASKCGIYHLCFWFTTSLHFFATYLHLVNLCKSDFSCSAGRVGGSSRGSRGFMVRCVEGPEFENGKYVYRYLFFFFFGFLFSYCSFILFLYIAKFFLIYKFSSLLSFISLSTYCRSPEVPRGPRFTYL